MGQPGVGRHSARRAASRSSQLAGASPRRGPQPAAMGRRRAPGVRGRGRLHAFESSAVCPIRPRLCDDPSMARLRRNRSVTPTRSAASRMASSRSTVPTTSSSAAPGSNPDGDGPPIQAIAGTASCQYHHLGVCARGRLGLRMDDGATMEVGPGWSSTSRPGTTAGSSATNRGRARLRGDAGIRPHHRPRRPDPCSILFTDVVDSTATADGWATRDGGRRSRPQRTVPVRRRPPPRDASSRRPATASSRCSTVRASGPVRRGRRRGRTATRAGFRAGVHTGEVELSRATSGARRPRRIPDHGPRGGGEVYVRGPPTSSSPARASLRGPR